ncbi:hypothetical protein CcaverHIS002_0309220 [Cutaneotrichosporon cavernicola]|uniref:SAP domain-containing protein n=1 Tax=Cutaneotrichosporon cavernicola TaxID=279322 RepID=A0AA48IH36_9TREE|nr:uncharacterized protein CcaverHIS019_0309080 [Cutaneotrichosporon cavernicola]BEI83054.1 hypothetical protein CcaverHIS002_0309220 [Cutaneotrichosporon cavernicola]BEI90838.1 hypothetical protein CcaverHIS019_0309080 [Cutaneotrichosporon cavernicola]BEI98617.1 hypothetical protein CcaverHIS631_0309160 [Cutaneotrichosporon cavernicola]BEJ06386.1 hypothetical protein CcaverHIS641_0309080 [Cutaneotrichosporon cavernicola]
MLRRRLSAGALRAQAQLHTQTPPSTPRKAANVTRSAAAAKATISPNAQSKSLGSVVLLNTQRSWKGETVVTLKAELKKRGLTQTGNKAMLVSRLESADTTGLAPPVPPISRVLRAEAKARAQRTRAYATPSGAKSAGREDAVSPVITTSEDVNVNAPAAEVPSVGEQTPEEKTSAPGLPSGKQTNPTPQEFTIHFPDPKPDKESPQTIPTLPHHITSTATRPLPDDVDENFGLPKIMTIASASTHPDGGPVHGTTKVTDDDLTDKVVSKAKEQIQAAKQAEDEILELSGLPVDPPTSEGSGKPSKPLSSDEMTAKVVSKAKEKIDAAKAATAEILELSGLPVDNPDDPLDMKGAGSYKHSARPLNPEEHRGAWILGGLIGGVVLLGWYGEKKKKGAKEQPKAEAKDKN